MIDPLYDGCNSNVYFQLNLPDVRHFGRKREFSKKRELDETSVIYDIGELRTLQGQRVGRDGSKHSLEREQRDDRSCTRSNSEDSRDEAIPASASDDDQTLASRAIGRMLMKGWILLDSTCPKCAKPLLTDANRLKQTCVLCGPSTLFKSPSTPENCQYLKSTKVGDQSKDSSQYCTHSSGEEAVSRKSNPTTPRIRSTKQRQGMHFSTEMMDTDKTRLIVTKAIEKMIAQGWTLLDRKCTTCKTPLLSKSKNQTCILCGPFRKNRSPLSQVSKLNNLHLNVNGNKNILSKYRNIFQKKKSNIVCDQENIDCDQEMPRFSTKQAIIDVVELPSNSAIIDARAQVKLVKRGALEKNASHGNAAISADILSLVSRQSDSSHSTSDFYVPINACDMLTGIGACIEGSLINILLCCTRASCFQVKPENGRFLPGTESNMKDPVIPVDEIEYPVEQQCFEYPTSKDRVATPESKIVERKRVENAMPFQNILLECGHVCSVVNDNVDTLINKLKQKEAQIDEMINEIYHEVFACEQNSSSDALMLGNTSGNSEDITDEQDSAPEVEISFASDEAQISENESSEEAPENTDELILAMDKIQSSIEQELSDLSSLMNVPDLEKCESDDVGESTENMNWISFDIENGINDFWSQDRKPVARTMEYFRERRKKNSKRHGSQRQNARSNVFRLTRRRNPITFYTVKRKKPYLIPAVLLSAVKDNKGRGGTENSIGKTMKRLNSLSDELTTGSRFCKDDEFKVEGMTMLSSISILHSEEKMKKETERTVSPYINDFALLAQFLLHFYGTGCTLDPIAGPIPNGQTIHAKPSKREICSKNVNTDDSKVHQPGCGESLFRHLFSCQSTL